MVISFPTSLDTSGTFPSTISGTDPQSAPDHAVLHNNSDLALLALEAKVGIDSSAVTTSLDYMVRNAPGSSLMTANGDLIIRAAGVPARLAVGGANTVLGVSAGLPAWQAQSYIDHANLSSLTTGDPHTQYRLEADNHTHQSSGAQAGQIDHGLANTGLTDDDHTQYLLLAGRAGGQATYGDTASGGNWVISSTAHATKGKILIGTTSMAIDEANTRIGIGTASPSHPLHITGTISSASANVRAMSVTPTFTGAGEGPYGALIQPTFTPSASINATYGGIYLANLGPAVGVTVSTAYGLYAGLNFNDTAGAVTNSVALNLQSPSIAGALKPTNHYGIYIDNQGASGISSAYSLYIVAPSGATNNYGLISMAAKNGIGTASPSYPFTVAGSYTSQYIFSFTPTLGGSTGSSAMANFAGTISTTGTYPTIFNLTSTFSGAADIISPIAMNFQPTFTPPNAQAWSGTATLMNMGLVTGSTTGTIAAMTGMLVFQSYGSIKPSTAQGISINNIGSAGIGTVYGVYIEAQSGGTTNWGLYINGGASTLKGNIMLGSGSLATTATDGFPYIPTCAGAPTGNSTDYAGWLPMVYDTTNNKLWVNTSGTTWKGVVLA